ncbi:uncharacterized protein LOC123712943 isoform X1 [Pieris brassicae]|uniref:uncharacterized protein LOC123712943 isoform X1 n=2 Tax=Pieris brassicae TaxID=7116 RepID=UPI001E661D13|nr:uncharacterized protein LOC123712943 isoform X1 [Pieris brassicae]
MYVCCYPQGIVMVIMSCMGDVALHDRVPVLWQQIEDAHYSYLEIDDSPEKLQQKKKLQGYITEYLSLVPNEYKFGLQETSKVFQRTVNELPDYSAYRAGIGWAAMARYAANLLAQPWRKEYKVVRLYCGFYKHEVEANLVGGESLLQAMGYRALGGGRLALDGPVCPDMAAAVSRDALIAQCESQILALQIMASIWEGVWSGGGRVSWAAVAAERLTPSRGLFDDDGVYSNMPAPSAPRRRPPCRCPDVTPFAMFPSCEIPSIPYAVPYYFPLRPSYAVPPPLYAPANPAPNDAVDGSTPRRPCPLVPTARLIEYDSERDERRNRRVDGPSRSDSRPALKAREDGTGTYESWDYVFRNLSSKDRGGDGGSGFSQSSDRDSRTLDRLERDDRRKYRPTTMDLEDGLRALDLDRSHDEEASRTAKVNESLMRLKREQESKRVKRRTEERTPEVRKPEEIRKTEFIGNPSADGLVTPKVAPDKVKLLSKKEIKDRKEVLKQMVNGQVSNVEVKKLKRPIKSGAAEVEKARKPSENGVHEVYGPRSVASSSQPSGLEAQLVVSLEDGRAERWQCGTCTYLNARGLQACDMCGKSKRGPRIQPLTSGGRECPACTLVNGRDAKLCDACGTGLDRCPTYI